MVDYHQHLFHPTVTGLAPDTGTITASELVAYLDAAGIRRAVVLSVAYQFGNPNSHYCCCPWASSCEPSATPLSAGARPAFPAAEPSRARNRIR